MKDLTWPSYNRVVAKKFCVSGNSMSRQDDQIAKRGFNKTSVRYFICCGRLPAFKMIMYPFQLVNYLPQWDLLRPPTIAQPDVPHDRAKMTCQLIRLLTFHDTSILPNRCTFGKPELFSCSHTLFIPSPSFFMLKLFFCGGLNGVSRQLGQ